MAAPTIPNGETQFFPIIYEGNGAGQRVGNFVPFTDNGTIANSVIFNDADNAYLSRTNDAGDRDTFTISVWVKRCALGSVQYILDTYDGSSTNDGMIRFNTDNTMSIRLGSPSSLLYITNRTFEDTSKFYHIMLSVNTGESTAADRAKLYVDGDRITSFSTQTTSGSVNTQFNYSSATFRIGSTTSGSYDFDGYLAEFNQVDGTALTPDTFGLTDTSTGRWIPKALTGITYGTNGFRLQFGTSSALGDDTSGNENDFSVTNLVAGDQTTDSPTQNFPTIDSNRSSLTLSEGNTVGTSPSTGVRFAFSTMTFDPFDKTGYYMEFKLIQATYSVSGFRLDDDSVSTSQTYRSDGYVAINYVNDWSVDDEVSFAGSGTLANNDILGVYIKDGKLYYSINGTMQNSSNSVAAFSKPGRYRITVGHNANYSPYASVQIICPQSKWTYTPSGDFANYREINQDNAPETSKGISGLVWIKERSASSNHQLYDSSRGAGQLIMSSSTNAESTRTDALYKFLKGGYAVGDNSSINGSGDSVVAWNWVANGGTTASNSNGSLSSTVQANTTAGFSIVEWTGDGGQSTVGHGLSGTPKVVIQKRLSSTSDWWFYTTALDGSYDYGKLNVNGSFAAQSAGSAPTSTTFTSHGWGSSDNLVAYVFHEVEGFSKFGSYTGNGVSNGPFIYTGFKVRWLMHKANNAASWYIYDTVREKNNPLLFPLFADGTYTESSNIYGIDFLSNGFKLRQPTGYGGNYSGVDVFYMAFAEHPFVGDGTSPVTAR